MHDTDSQDDGTEHSIVDQHDLDKPDWETSWRGTPRPPEETVCMFAEALEPDDEIIINDRSRSLRVLGFEEQQNPGLLKSTFYPAYILWLRGNGTEYRLRWSHTGDYYPKLHTESELETRESYSVKHGEVRSETIADGRGSTVHWIRPVDVDESKVSEWAFARNVDGLEDCTVDTDSDR